MSHFEWPEQILPLPSARFDLRNESNVLRSRMETGRFRQRRRFTTEYETSTLVFDLVDSEFSNFKAIWKYKLLSGSNWFKMRLPVGDGEKLTLCEVRFTANYRARHAPHENWTVTAPVEFKESKTMSEDELDIGLIYGGTLEGFQEDVDAIWAEVTHFTTEHSFT